MTHDRRTFLATLGGFAALRSTAGAQSTAARPAASGIDIGWFDALKGRHKQVFDCGTFDLSSDSPLRQPVTYLTAHRDLNHLEPPDDINALVGVSHRAFPMNANDAMWQKYRLGELWHIKDPSTHQPATRNIFAGPPTGATGATVRGLQARGVIFWQCNFALGSVSSDIADAVNGKAAEIRADLGANLLPGVRLVPAHTWALGYVQERGFAYEKLDAR